MKKSLILALMLIMLPAVLFAMTSSSSMEVSAYKNPPNPQSLSSFRVLNLLQTTSTEITGFERVFDISTNISSNRTISKLFSLEFSSNLRSSVNCTLVVTPFIDQANPSNTLPATYTATANTPSAVKGTSYYRYKSNRYYFAQYTPSISVQSSTTVNSTTNIQIVFNPTGGGVKTANSNTNNVNSIQNRNWQNSSLQTVINDASNNDGRTLPGLADGQVVTATVTFGLSITQANYTNMQANTDYVATISVLLETV